MVCKETGSRNSSNLQVVVFHSQDSIHICWMWEQCNVCCVRVSGFIKMFLSLAFSRAFPAFAIDCLHRAVLLFRPAARRSSPLVGSISSEYIQFANACLTHVLQSPASSLEGSGRRNNNCLPNRYTMLLMLLIKFG